MDAGGDFFDFLRYAADKDPENRKYGKKVLDTLKNPKASPQDLQELFKAKGFKVPIEDCRRLKDIEPGLIPDVDPRAGY